MSKKKYQLIGETKEYVEDQKKLERKIAETEGLIEYLEKELEELHQVRYERWLPKTIGDLELSVRAYNALMNHGLDSFDKIATAFINGDIKKIRGIGKNSHRDIEKKLIPFLEEIK